MAELRVKETGTIKLFESDNTSSVTIASPASLGADRTITLPDASVTLASGTMLATDGSGASLTALNASELGSGTVPTARLGSGTASSSTVLYGDQTYKAEPGGDNTPAILGEPVTAAAGLSDAAWTRVSFTEALDSDGAFDGTTFTVPAGMGGYYQYNIILDVDAYTTYASYFWKIQMGLYKNGALDISTYTMFDSYAAHLQISQRGVAGVIELAATDTCEVYVNGNTQASQWEIKTDGQFSIYRLIGI